MRKKTLKDYLREYLHRIIPIFEYHGDDKPFHYGYVREIDKVLSEKLYKGWWTGETVLLNENDRNEIQFSNGDLIVTVEKSGQITRWSTASKAYRYDSNSNQVVTRFYIDKKFYFIVSDTIANRKEQRQQQLDSNYKGYRN